MSKIDFEQINRNARCCLTAVLRRLLPGGKIVGHEYLALNPRRVDRNLGSFSVNINTGKWADFSTGDRGGDPVSLIAYIEGVSQSEGARRLARLLGVQNNGGRHD